MGLFLSSRERDLILQGHGSAPLDRHYFALLARTARHTAAPGLMRQDTTVDWWHCAGEYITDSALCHNLSPTQQTAKWLAPVVMDIVRRPASDWVGPAFRKQTEPPVGQLETAHLGWAVAVALDLAPDVFEEGERQEIRDVLQERAIPMCRRWLDANRHLNNWRLVLNSGVAVVAAVLDDRPNMELAAQEFEFCNRAFQRDGSYAEGLLYGGYAALVQMMSYEALTRRDAQFASRLNPGAYAMATRWWAASLLYNKPLSGWGHQARPRWTNFNDCGSIANVSGDVLLHISARCKEQFPQEAGLARWFFETLYGEQEDQGPEETAGFGYSHRFGFLTMQLLLEACAPLTPQAAGLTSLESFSCGDTLARDEWGGRTILAVRGGGDALHAPGHLHGDLNSFILVHNRERLLVDPGHSCYRNLIRELDVSSSSHNTCTFRGENPSGVYPQRYTLTQQTFLRRTIGDGILAPPIERGGTSLLAKREGAVLAIGSEVAALYGGPLTEFSRFWLLCGSHVLFVVDQISSREPLATHWHWILNNRDGRLDIQQPGRDTLVARRGNAGLKLIHTAGGTPGGPSNGYLHDAYHPRPGQLGEGRPGSALHLHWSQQAASRHTVALHAIALDSYSAIGSWSWSPGDKGGEWLGAAGQSWKITIDEHPLRITVCEGEGGGQWRVGQDEAGTYGLHREPKE